MLHLEGGFHAQQQGLGSGLVQAPKAILPSAEEAVSLMPEISDYISHSFPLTVTEHRCFKAETWKIKKHLRPFTPSPPLS